MHAKSNMAKMPKPRSTMSKPIGESKAPSQAFFPNLKLTVVPQLRLRSVALTPNDI